MNDKPVFKSKKEKIDFWIAIAVIAFFMWLFWFLFGSGALPKVDLDNIMEKSEIEIEAQEIDTDGDGISDSVDLCPTLFGTDDNNGCPSDADGDGVFDENDACPRYAGLASNNGCPPDSDGDGLHDLKDKCPNVFAQTENGCIADLDNDGVEDSVDKCPNKFGPIANNGCPEFKIEAEEKAILVDAMSSVKFKTGSAELDPVSNRVLDKIAAMMSKYPKAKITIKGHTDNVGDPSKNLELSEARAASCLNYLKTKNVNSSRMTSRGFGERKPIASNETPEGQRKNRRVEFELSY